MSGVQSVSTERLNSLLGHVTHRGYDDLVDPKNQGIAYPTGNPDVLITGDPLFYTNLLATLDMFRLNSASLTFGTTDEGNQFRNKSAGTRIFDTSKQWWSIISYDLLDTKAKTFPSTTRCSLLALRLLRGQLSSVKFKGTSVSLEQCVTL